MAQSNVVQITTKVTVQADALFADAVLANLIACAKEQRKMLKAQEMAFKILTDQIRESLGEFNCHRRNRCRNCDLQLGKRRHNNRQQTTKS